MSNGNELWDAAAEHGAAGSARSVNALRFCALAKVLAEAETAWLTGNDPQAAERLRQLQVHCERMILDLAPMAAGKATFVASAA